MLFLYLLLTGGGGGATKAERTKNKDFFSPTFPAEVVNIGSLTWEMFLGFFQIISRRQVLSENEHSASGLIFEGHL